MTKATQLTLYLRIDNLLLGVMRLYYDPTALIVKALGVHYRFHGAGMIAMICGCSNRPLRKADGYSGLHLVRLYSAVLTSDAFVPMPTSPPYACI
jgi:hypothetical protein